MATKKDESGRGHSAISLQQTSEDEEFLCNSQANALLQDTALGVENMRRLDPVALRQLSRHLVNLANALEQMSGAAGQVANGCPTDLDLLGAARKAYSARRMRTKYLSEDLFAEPAWDILLDLYIKHIEGHEISVTSCCMASAVPPTTALRWLTILEAKGLVARRDSRADRRTALVSLSPEGARKMGEILAADIKRDEATHQKSAFIRSP